ncbi:glycosyltransferase family 4 protein [Schaalia sp. 19OD2882]|uniref:glycosyltransferase family 4 protein n=1 Tax=Schaalia sp. 19OD2882 TaxID=2794089 RepID=UPI001C1EE0DD|nr:glycosyltransferase family 4 protein [Schaalia sp. 19OD2882]QWW20272.1 glycosyltransferase family 4 protein [Schaalia sp. 19OD2882]
MSPSRPPRPTGGGRPVLMVTRIHLPEAAAASFRLDAVERALVRAGRAVHALTTTVPGQTPTDPEGLRVSRWPALRDKSGYLRGYVPYMSYDLPLFVRLLVAPKASVALVEPPPTTGVVSRIALGARRIPYVWYAPDVWSDATEATDAPAVVKKAVKWMESFAVSGAKAVVAVNDEVAARVRELGARKVHVVPNGIDTDIFSTDGGTPTCDELEAAGVGSRYFVYAGTASEWQGADVFVRALARVRAQHPQVQLLFLGQGSYWPHLAELGERIPDFDGRRAVLFRASVPPEEAARWQRGALASLVSIKPGIGYDFAYPTKVLASLACGTPVLYAGVGPARADVDDFDLGWACDHEVDPVAALMTCAVESEADDQRRERLRAWVVENRSIRATGDRVAAIVQGVARD